MLETATGRLVGRYPVGRYPYGVAVAGDGTVYVSAWGGWTVSVFGPTPDGALEPRRQLQVARHPSALLLNRSGTRLFVASASTDRVAVIDTRTGQRLVELADPPPEGPDEGSTPNALALSPDGTLLYVAEADNNAVAVFALSPASADVPGAPGDDRLAGRIPVDWYPTVLAPVGDSLLVLSAKGRPGREPRLGPSRPARRRAELHPGPAHRYARRAGDGPPGSGAGSTHRARRPRQPLGPAGGKAGEPGRRWLSPDRARDLRHQGEPNLRPGAG